MASEAASSLSAGLLATLGHGEAPPPGLPRATGAAFDSRRVMPGDAFFALPGDNEHGIAYADDALRRGAAFVVSDVPHPRGVHVGDPEGALLALGRHARSGLRANVIGISGSVGKTSTRAYAAAALDAVATTGNLNTPRALACTLVSSWLGDPYRNLVLELGIDRPGEMDELLDLVRPTHGLLTAIAESHLERLGSIEGVAREKARLLERSVERLASTGAAARLPRPMPGLVRYGLRSDADISGATTPDGAGGQRLRALGVEIGLSQPGDAMAENALGALALASRLGLDLELAARRIAAATLEPGRLERKRCGGRIVLDDSYNSNPASARAALQVLSASPAPRCAVLGDMLELGDESARLHRELGAATRGLDLVIAVGSEARHLVEGNPEALHADSAEAATGLLERLPSGGTVLVKASRGMRLERLVARLEQEAASLPGEEAP